jgi:hypothetical protein
LFGLASQQCCSIAGTARDLERDAEAVDKAPDSDQRRGIALARRRAATPSFTCGDLVEGTLRRRAALPGVLFWFAVPPAGALLYRLIQVLASRRLRRGSPDKQRSPLQVAARVLTGYRT